MRQVLTYGKLPIRINAIAPSWTKTGIVPEKVMDKLGVTPQEPEVPARAALLLMVDESRNGQLMHAAEGQFKEVEESILIPAAHEIIGKDKTPEDVTLMKMLEVMEGVYQDEV
jgi:hypothetical protein